MSTLEPDAVLEVRFLTTEEGGRASPVESDRFGCPLLINRRGFDCRFVLEGTKRFEPGETYQVEVKFLDPDAALKEIQAGAAISLWEGREIAKGGILRILALPTR